MRKFYLVFTVVLLLFSAAYAQSTAPVITSFTPVAGTYRDTIIIKGSGLLETNGVFFGGIRSGYLRLVNDSILYAGVPLGKTGDVTVETSFGTAVKSGFTYILPLVVAFSPLYGPPGTTVTITGGPFNIDPAENIVHFGAVQTTAVTASKDTLTAVIPTGANSAMIRVQANGSGGYSKDHFLVTLPGEDLTNHFSFSAPVNMDDLYNVKGIGAADFDGDGKPDVATINQSTSVVSVYKNSSTLEEIGFTPKIDLAAGGIPVELITGDVDVDGKPDIIMKINQPNKLVVLRNTSSNGVISFASPVSFTAITFIGFPPFYGRTMAMRDIDGDGKPEIISANSSDHTFTVFRNTGSAGIISFATPYDVPCDNNPSAIIIEDFDGDSKADVIVLSSGSWFSTFRNTSSAGNISFTSTVVGGEASSTVFSLTAGDYDADGKVDLAVVTIVTRQLTIFRNTSSSGAISFAPRVERPLAYYPNYLEHGDFDGDGKKDWLVLSQNNRSSLSISRNLSSSGSIATGFSQDFSAGFWPAQSIVADLNGDGKPDIITTEYNGRGTYFFRNTLHDPGIQSFAPMTAKKGDTVIVKGWNFASAVQVRFGGVLAMSFTVLDDSTIVAVVGQGGSGKIVVTNSAGSGTKSGFVFGIPPVIISFSPLSGPAASTVIIKGKHFGNTISDNTVLIGGARAIISTASDTALTVIVPSGAAYYPITVTNSDSLTAYSEQRFGLTFPGAMDTLVAQATFTHRLSLNAADQTLHLKQADLNGDGKNDLICASSNGHELRIYQNTSINGVLSFAPPLNYNIAFPNNLVIDDVNGDGKADIVMATTGNGITIIQNTSIGESLSFQEVSVSAGYPLFRLGIRDLDGDGKTDLVTTGFVSGVTRLSIYRNVSIGGNISFESPVFYDINILFSFCHLIEDVNKDGKPDICVQALSGQIDTLYIFNNMSQPGTLSFVKGKGLPIGERGSFNMVAGDLDGDTLPDFVKGNRSASAKSLAILPNKSSNGVIDFDPLVTVNAGHLPQYLAISDVDGDGQPDIATINDTSNAVSFFRNKSITGSMVFAGNTELPSGSSPVAFCFGDLDGDGKPDLAVVNYSVDSISIYHNKTGEALVIPSGTNPVTGGMTNKVTIDPTVQTYQGHPYVQRHYDITPVNNPATATATLTLYFTQEEFDNYNAHGAHGLDLPHNATDNLNKANLRVYQYHGFSTTSQPGSYSGNGVEINPDDAKIVWNATTLQWEVTFDVNGFSGFFIGSAGSSILPVTIISFTGNARDQKALLQWTTTREINVAHFELQRRDNTSDFVSIGKINPAGSSSLEYNYEYTDQLGESPVYHYRLKIVDIDESITYSKIVTIKPGATNTLLSLKPNPAKDFVVVKHPAKNGGAQIRVVDMFGKTLQTVTVTSHSTQTRIVLNGWPKGSYTLVWDGGSEKASQVLIIQ